MASLAQLMKYGSVGADGSFSMDVVVPKSKFKWDRKRFRKLYGEAERKALIRSGLITKRHTQKQMRRRKPLSRPKQWRVGSRFGLNLYALINRVPLSDKITSWKTTRNPSGMLYADIEDDFDMRTRTVVVGPSKFPVLNEVQEKGGTMRRYFKPIPKRARGNKVYGILTNTPPTTVMLRPDRNNRLRRKRVADVKPFSFAIRIKPRAYMGKGIASARPKIPEQFRDQIRGP